MEKQVLKNEDISIQEILLEDAKIEYMKGELVSQGRAILQIIKNQLDQVMSKANKSIKDGFFAKEEALLLAKLSEMQGKKAKLKEKIALLKD